MGPITQDRAAAPAAPVDDADHADLVGPSGPAGSATPAPAEPRSRSGRGWVRRLVTAGLVALAVTGGGYGYEALAGESAPAPALLGPGDVTVRLGVEHSLFDADEIRVVEGTRVRFVVDNGDPIGHELITGPPAIHVQHANGTHPRHASIPGEVSVGAGQVAVTTFTFDEPGEFEFACHLPGHYEYGMHGTVVVEPAD